MFKELFTEAVGNEQKQLFQEVEDYLVQSGIRPPRGLKNQMKIVKINTKDNIVFKMTIGQDPEQVKAGMVKFKKYIDQNMSGTVTVKGGNQNATKKTWDVQISLKEN